MRALSSASEARTQAETPKRTGDKANAAAARIVIDALVPNKDTQTARAAVNELLTVPDLPDLPPIFGGV